MPEQSENSSAPDAFVEVALPLPPRQTFTYELPAGLVGQVEPGSRLLVPFGGRVLTGYAVALHSELDAGLGIDPSSVKSVTELLDESPLVNSEILELTKWSADYYAASWGEMLKASLPAGINAAAEQVIEITELGRQHQLGSANLKPVEMQVLKKLAGEGPASRRALEKEFGASGTRRAVRELLKADLVTAHERIVTEKVKAKRRKAVRLLSAAQEPDVRLTDQQVRVLDALKSRNGEMLFTDLLEAAAVGASSINTLAKRGMLEVFTEEVYRDPFAGVVTGAREDIVLNSEQAF